MKTRHTQFPLTMKYVTYFPWIEFVFARLALSGCAGGVSDDTLRFAVGEFSGRQADVMDLRLGQNMLHAAFAAVEYFSCRRDEDGDMKITVPTRDGENHLKSQAIVMDDGDGVDEEVFCVSCEADLGYSSVSQENAFLSELRSRSLDSPLSFSTTCSSNGTFAPETRGLRAES